MGIWRYGFDVRSDRVTQSLGDLGVDVGEQRGTHVPVLLERCLELLAPALALPGAVHVDFTLGLGGHAEAVLERFPDVVLIGLDRDPEALAHSGRRLARFADRTHLVHAIYDELPSVLAELGHEVFHSGLFDLGVSSLQLDEPDRGFAYARDAPLDMRMDQSAGMTAEEVVNGYEPGELVGSCGCTARRSSRPGSSRRSSENDRSPGSPPRRSSPTWSGTPSRPPRGVRVEIPLKERFRRYVLR